MKTKRFLFLGLILSLVFAVACSRPATTKLPAELKNSYRQEVNGWVFVHLEGTPREVGFQNGYHLAAEIDDELQMFAFFLEKYSGHDWSFFREAASRMFWPKVDPEYQEEIQGIVDGLKARLPDRTYDVIDLTALNGWIELAWYYVPYLAGKASPGADDNKSPSHCSAFIATGNYTEDRKIVMAHNNWVEYIVGERWNIIVDMIPAKGHRILMDTLPGAIHSGDDFVINGAGIMYTETTIGMYKGFDETGTPEFVRARRAAQYAGSIDEFIRLMSEGNNGAYANDWLVGDLKTNEIARLELGLKNQQIWRTSDGYFIGANFPSDPKVIAEETTYRPGDMSLGVNVRKARWEKLMEDNKGTINAETAMIFEADHVDASTGRPTPNGKTLCGHIDADPQGLPEFLWTPYYPAGSVQAKVTTSRLAGELKMWARRGHPCGQDFIAGDFFAAHPEYAWMGKFLKDMKAFPWTLFEAKK
jgi:Phospholipase B